MLAIIITTTVVVIIINPGTEIEPPLLAEGPSTLHKAGVTGADAGCLEHPNRGCSASPVGTGCPGAEPQDLRGLVLPPDLETLLCPHAGPGRRGPAPKASSCRTGCGSPVRRVSWKESFSCGALGNLEGLVLPGQLRGGGLGRRAPACLPSPLIQSSDTFIRLL